jgi:hypothetical protein
MASSTAGGRLEAAAAEGGRGKSECVTTVTRAFENWRARQDSNLCPPGFVKLRRPVPYPD